MIRSKKLIAGNWKMNGIQSSLAEIDILKNAITDAICDIIICPPATLLSEAVKLTTGSRIAIGAQNCHHELSGAFTGEISPEMLNDIGIRVVILGHSERRINSFESNELVNKKAKSSHDCGLNTIICVGESETEKENHKTENIVREQVAKSLPVSATDRNTIIAYEPIWAIGTGKTATSSEIIQVHYIIRNELEKLKSKSIAQNMRILYGGSVNSKNCSELLHLDGVDGALVGGASLLSSEFSQIIFAC